MSDTPSLAVLVIEFLARQPGQAYPPWRIAEGVGVGAVIPICLHLAAEGSLVQASPAPKTFVLAARTEDPSGQQ